jgi:hypothetical protein
MKKVRGRVFTPVYIRSSMISSLEGLRLSPDWRVQARAIVMSEAHIWDERNEEYERERLFIEAVCAFVDVAPERRHREGLASVPISNRRRTLLIPCRIPCRDIAASDPGHQLDLGLERLSLRTIF